MEPATILLPGFIDFIDKNHFEDFITDVYNGAQGAGLTTTHYFSFPSGDELKAFFRNGNRQLFDSLLGQNLSHYITVTKERWLQRQESVISSHELSINDAGMYGYVRKKVFLKYIRLFTTDTEAQFNLICEIDQLMLEINTAFNTTFSTLLKEKLERELYLNGKITETFPGIIYVFDIVANRNVYSNNNITRLLGYTPEELRERGSDIIASVIHPDDMEESYSHIEHLKTLKQGEIDLWEFRAIHKNGSIRWIRVYQSVFLVDSEGMVSQIIGIGNDVTEHKIAEADLAKSQRDLEMAQAIARLGSYEWEIGTNKVHGSLEFRKMFEWDEEGKRDRRSKIHPNDLERVDEAMRICAQTLDDFDCEYRIITAEGERTVWSRGKVSDVSGTKILKGTVLDITEKSHLMERLKQSDFLYRQAQAISHIGNWELDIATNRLEWSDEMYHIFSINKQTELIPKETVSGFIHPDDRPVVEEMRRRVLECSDAVDFHYRIITAEGKVKNLHAITEVLCIDGKAVKMYGTVQDVTKLLETERKLEEMNLQLKRTNESLEEFAYIASHDLKAPVRKIMIFSQQLAASVKEQLSPDGKSLLDRIYRSATKMQTLIDDILNFSTAATPADMVSTDLNNILAEVIEIYETQIAGQNISISLTQLPAVEVIPYQIKQLFQNLISNSIKFAGDEPLEIKVSHEELDVEERHKLNLHPDSDYLKLVFADNGIGFENEYAYRIFSMFHRLNDKTGYDGNGIGLAICKKIVDNHKGLIMANGNPGKGAAFTIILPMHQRGSEGTQSIIRDVIPEQN